MCTLHWFWLRPLIKRIFSSSLRRSRAGFAGESSRVSSLARPALFFLSFCTSSCFPNSEHEDLSSSISRIVSRPLAPAFLTEVVHFFLPRYRLAEENRGEKGEFARRRRFCFAAKGPRDLRSNPKLVFRHVSCTLLLLVLLHVSLFYCSPLSRNRRAKPWGQWILHLARPPLSSPFRLSDFLILLFLSVPFPSWGVYRL